MYNIICADDDKYMQILYQNIFADRGNKVRLCSDGDSVLLANNQDPADLIILDLDMPGKSGLDLCKVLRTNPITFNTPIIMVSAHDSEDIIVTSLLAGANDYIIKPFKPAELLAKSRALLTNGKLLQHKKNNFETGSLFAGKYEIVRNLGSGGFSSVFLARELEPVSSSSEVALKLIEISKLKQDEPAFTAIFLREAYSLSKLDNPNIVKLLDFGHTNDYYFLAMEYLEGKTLQQIIDETGAVDENETAFIAHEIARALQTLENHKVVHRDIKPINIMIVKNGDVKLIDFGLARSILDDTITMDGIFKGTPQFAAPEIIRMESEVDISADIFSLGATLFYLASNEKPFSGENPYKVFQNRLKEIPRPLRDVVPSISFQFSQLIDKMLSTNKKNRPSLDEVVSVTNKIITTS